MHDKLSPPTSPHAHLRARRTALGPWQVSQSCDAAGSCDPDAGLLLSVEDAGETEDVRGLHEAAADDGRPQRPLRGPDAGDQESGGGRHQGFHRRTGKMLPGASESDFEK